MLKSSRKITLLAGIIALLVFSFASTGMAQDQLTLIRYGDTITDQITADAAEIRYTFAGHQGDVVIISMVSDGTDAGLATPAFQVLNGDQTLIDSTRLFTLALTIAYAAFELPADGDYLLVATRRSGDPNVGSFTLKLNNAAPMEAGQAISDSGSDSTEQFYVIAPDSPYTLSYTKTGGTFSPMIGISVLGDAGATEPAADMSGMRLNMGTLTVTPDAGTLYLVRVGRGFLSPSRGTVEYTLMYSAG